MFSTRNSLIALAWLLLQMPLLHGQVLPTSYTLNISPVSRDGSSENGSCSSPVILASGRQRCDTPHTSVLFDGVIPTLAGIDNSMLWASQLLTLHGNTPITFDFTQVTNDDGVTIQYNGLSAIEVVMFNCPSRHVGGHSITVLDSDSNGFIATIPVNSYTSCDHLIRGCVTPPSVIASKNILFTVTDPLQFIYLAEVTFHTGRNRDCSSAGIIKTSTSSATPTCSPTATTAATTTTITNSIEEFFPTDVDDSSQGFPSNSATILASTAANPIINSSQNNSTTTVIIVVVIISLTVIFTILLIVILFLLCRKKIFSKHNDTNFAADEYQLSTRNTENKKTIQRIQHFPVTDEVLVDDAYAAINNGTSKEDEVHYHMYSKVEEKSKANSQDIPEMYSVVNKRGREKGQLTDGETDSHNIAEMYAVVDKTAKKKAKRADVKTDGQDISELYSVLDRSVKKNGRQADETTKIQDITEMYAVVDKSAKKINKPENGDISQMYAVVDKKKKRT